jgi:hypothetical protein
MERRRSTSVEGPVSVGENHIVGIDSAGPPGRRIAPTAVEREILFGRTIKLFSPGIIRRPMMF